MDLPIQVRQLDYKLLRRLLGEVQTRKIRERQPAAIKRRFAVRCCETTLLDVTLPVVAICARGGQLVGDGAFDGELKTHRG